jgi:outer membrane autotransporter protein
MGALNILGDLTFLPGSLFAVRVVPGLNDSAIVSGVATLAGTVQVSAGSTNYLPSQRYTILTALSGVSGTFSGVSTNLFFLTPSLSYDSNNVYLTLEQEIPFSAVARNINQRNVGNAMTLASKGAIGPLGANVINTLLVQSAQSAPGVLDNISGAALSGVQTVSMEAGKMASSTISDQIAFWRSGESRDASAASSGQEGARSFIAYAPVERNIRARGPIKIKGPTTSFSEIPQPRLFRAWSSFFGGGANFLADYGRGTPAANAAYYGGLLGVDYQIAPGVLIGAALGGSTASFNAGQFSTSGKMTGFHAGLYGSYAKGASYVSLSETFSAYSNQTNRTAGGYGFLAYEQLNASFSSTEFRTRVEGGHALAFGGLTATPFVAAEAAAYQSGAFSERSSLLYFSSLALKNNGQSILSLPAFVGLRLSNGYTLANGWRITPTGSVAYVHEFFPQRRFTNVLISLPGQDFTVAGPRATYNLVQTKIGLEINLTNQLALVSNFQGEFSSVSQSYGGKAGVRYYW